MGTFQDVRLVSLKIEGTTPLLCNRFTDEAQLQATGGTRTSVNGEQPSVQDQARSKLYLGIGGEPMIPQPNFFRCLIDGGKYFKIGRNKVTTMKTSMIPACVEIEAAEIPILHRESWSVDTRAVRIPSTGGRILCHRPCFHDWQLNVELKVDTELMPLSLLRQIVDASGKRVGLGDFRPDCKGPFGKFVVTSWEVD